MATPEGPTKVNTSIQSDEQDTEQGPTEISASIQDFNESQEWKTEAAKKRLSQREEPVNMLVIGPTGAGKSTLINALLGNTVAKVGHGAASVQSGVEVHEGKHEGIQLRVYDTTGFSDTRGKSGNSIVREIAQSNKFDLILICIRMDSRADEKVKDMFAVLAANIKKEMWDRSVIVLTFANAFLQLKNIRKEPNQADIIRSEIKYFKGHIQGFFSSTLKNEAIDEIPFCIAGDDDELKLPTTHDWIKNLWNQCVRRSSEDARSFLQSLAKFRMTLISAGPIYGGTAAGAVVGGAIGGAVGTVLPVTGNIVGAAAGAVIGAGVGATISGVALAVKRKKKEQPPDTKQKK
uniref:AIG1-type G domain-containing protein n=1 Tax=Amphimedon queenslandica TaxID=400682 RepID=A0A1X7TYS3_AMPQE